MNETFKPGIRYAWFVDQSTGSASLIRKMIVADFPLSLDLGEITDKGSINQSLILQNHPEALLKLYSELNLPEVITIY